MDSNASRARKVERKVWQDNDFSLAASSIRSAAILVAYWPL
jgi:hypothetical protein